MIDVQEQMALDLSVTSLELTRRKSELTREIKRLLSGKLCSLVLFCILKTI